MQFAAVDDAPEFVILGHLAQYAAVAENHERNKVRLFMADFEEMFQRKNMSDILTNWVVERMLGVCVQVLVPALAFKVACDFARKVFAFKNVNARLVQKQCVDFGVACSGRNVQVPHQHITALVGVANACGQCHHGCFAKNTSRVVCNTLVVEF